MHMKWVKAAFAASAVYDGILALVFLFFAPPVFQYFNVEMPNHPGYLQFPALLLIVFALMYWKIASDPLKFKELIPFGIGLKVSYCLAVFYNWAGVGVPSVWIPLAWIDLIFLVFFVIGWRNLGTAGRAAA